MPRLQGEPALGDLWSDPMALALPKRDGIDLGTLRNFIRDLQRSRLALAEHAADRQRAHHGKDAPP